MGLPSYLLLSRLPAACFPGDFMVIKEQTIITPFHESIKGFILAKISQNLPPTYPHSALENLQYLW
jgi:hypothetical protein